MTLKETIHAGYDNITAEIYQLIRCRVYWIKIFEQKGSRKKLIMVKVIGELRDFNYRAIKEFITESLFREAKERLAHARKTRPALITP
ncbi:MAG: hypothetical protein ACFFAN_02780 [Promethearchaeota archaeon]